MKRIMAVSVLALGLAGCNATVYDGGYYRPRPVVDVYTPAPYPVARPYYQAPHPVFVATPRPRCYSTWDRTPYGMRERRVCH